jgi:hypothetical protein
MSLRRYTRTPILIAGRKFGTSNLIPIIRTNIENGTITYATYVTKENERLDILAGKYYNDGKLWWLIAAASNIGWGLQVPSNIILKIPKLEEAAQFIG